MSAFDETTFVVDEIQEIDDSGSGEEKQKDFGERAAAWFAENYIPPHRLDVAEEALSVLRDDFNIDFTVPKGITSLFLTHKAETVPWEVVVMVWELVHSGPVAVEDLWLMLYWEFEQKYPAGRRSYASKFTLSDVVKMHRRSGKSAFDHIRPIYWPKLRRNLPNDLEHLKALEKQTKTGNHPVSSTDKVSSVTSLGVGSVKSTVIQTAVGSGSSAPIIQQAVKRALPPTEENPPCKKQRMKMTGGQAGQFGRDIHKLWESYRSKHLELEKEMQGYIQTIHFKSLTNETEVTEWYKNSLKTLASEEAQSVENMFDALTVKKSVK